MLFNSDIFLFYFLPLVVIVYYVMPRTFRLHWLLAASYVFYGSWRARYVGLLALLTVINYLGGMGVSRSRSRRKARVWLTISVSLSLGALGYFKYTDFLLRTWNSLSLAVGVGGRIEPLGILLPVGISFFIFQSMSYPIDLYRGVSQPTRRFIDFACYVALFPQLVAGPIVRYHEIDHQLTDRSHTLEKFARGLVFFIVGLAKKAILADSLAPLAAAAFGHEPGGGAALAWVGALAYTFQIYFDFSGYSDMAIGLGLLFGFEFPQNFNSPYRAVGIRDFWRRWHMSLSRWLRDYVYIPLGGSRSGPRSTYVNVMVTMLLGGLWHGANWTFVLWGGYHGALICAERSLKGLPLATRLPDGLKRAATFLLVLFGFVLFRSDSVGHALRFSEALLGVHGLGYLSPDVVSSGALLALASASAIVWMGPNLWAWRLRISWPALAWAAPLFLASVYTVLVSGYSPFLYFQF